MAAILTGRWSNRFLLLLTLAGFGAVAITYVVHIFAKQPWALFAALLSVGEALFCWIVGLQIWRSGEGAAVIRTARP